MKAWTMALWLAFAVGWPAPSAAATATAVDKGSTTQTRRAKSPRPPVNTGYGESRKERDQRLLRECRGKPNAGACEGYAH